MKAGLLDVATTLDATLVGENRSFDGVSTDTRTLAPGNLFVALKGPRFDAHDFLAQARACGAAAALVEHPRVDVDLSQLVVADTRKALGQLANQHRRTFAGPVIGITGSNGKTTVKGMVAEILSGLGPCLVTRGNLNNEIGVPLTLLGLDPMRHQYAVIEMGANHQGEIARLAAIAEPTIGLITNAGPAHLEGFGGLDGVARGKSEIFSALGRDGIAVLNADDDYAAFWGSVIDGRRTVTFGLDRAAAVTGWHEPTADGAQDLTLVRHARWFELRLNLPGRHNARNALAAAACALAAGATLEQCVAGLARFQPVAGRLTPRLGRAGAKVLDDTYNANPASLAAGLAVLADLAPSTPRWLVLGDMGELGTASEHLHREAGDVARRAGVDKLFAVGPLSQAAVQAFGSGATHFPDRPRLVAALEDALTGDPVAILVKGSRSAGMETVVAALCPGPRPGEANPEEAQRCSSH